MTSGDFSAHPARSGARGHACARPQGWCRVTDEQKSKLDTKVDAFVSDLVSADANSPEFGEKVDQITRMGQEQIRAAAAMSNRFLDRPVRAMDGDGTVGKDLAELRRNGRGSRSGPQGQSCPARARSSASSRSATS